MRVMSCIVIIILLVVPGFVLGTGSLTMSFEPAQLQSEANADFLRDKIFESNRPTSSTIIPSRRYPVYAAVNMIPNNILQDRRHETHFAVEDRCPYVRSINGQTATKRRQCAVLAHCWVF